MDRSPRRSLTPLAASVATAAFAATMLMQVMLAVGVLPISMFWGGTQKVLTAPLRLASLASVGLLGLFAYLIRWRAGLSRRRLPTWVKGASWVITAFLMLNTLGNALSASLAEKFISGSVSLTAAVACLVVSASKPAARAERPTPAA